MEGQCEFCGKYGKTTIANIFVQQEKNNFNPQYGWQLKVAELYRCNKCKFLQIAKPIAPMLLLIFAIWVFLFFNKVVFIFYAILSMTILYNPLQKFVNKIFYTKNISEVLIEKKLPELNSNIYGDNKYYIKNDGIKALLLMFLTFIIPAIFMFSFQQIYNAQLSASFEKNKRLGIGYLQHKADKIYYNNKGSYIGVTVQLQINKQNQTDTLYEYMTTIESYTRDSCLYYKYPQESLDSSLQKIFGKVVCVPMLYDATNKINGKLLLSKYDYDASGYDKEKIKEQSGIADKDWRGYDSLFALIENFKANGRCVLQDDLNRITK